MAELDSRHRLLFLDERSNPGKTGNVRVIPDACIAMRDAPALLHGGRLDEYDARAALRELAEVHEVPVGDMAVLGRVLAHRRNDDAVARGDVAQLDGLEKSGH